MDGKETEKKHRMIGLYADFELENWRELRKYKMCESIATMLEETEKRAKIQVLTESIEALVSQGYSPSDAMRFLKIPEEEQAGYLKRLNSGPEE